MGIHYVAFLRGINVSGKNKILMSELSKVFLSLDFSDIMTYVQSGNVIFNSEETENSLIKNKIESAIKSEFGYDILVIIKSQNELIEIYKSNPFINESNNNIEKLYITFLETIPENSLVNKFLQADFSPDKFLINGNVIYLNYADKYSDSKLITNFWESKLKVKASSRNWKTISSIFKLITQ
jgi:uncharacterized protein (DUF1697 family)